MTWRKPTTPRHRQSEGASAGSVGQHYETVALQYLQQRGLRLLERNYRCRGGEIDLVMRDGETLVFVEVKYRGHSRFGDGLSQVNYRKQQKLRHAALTYLGHNPSMAQRACRFDVIGVGSERGAPVVNWAQNAF